MSRKLISILFLCMALLALPVPPVQAAGEIWTYPIIPSISGPLASHLAQIVKRGKALGNRLDVFSKVGDSITADPLFLSPVGTGGLRLGSYGYLQSTVNFFTRTMAHDNNSFANISMAAHGQWASRTVLDPGAVFSPACQPGETPLDCEFRVTRPSVALIMFGANDVLGISEGEFEGNLNRIVDIAEAHGVIPVLSTTLSRFDPPDSEGRVIPFNMITIRVARQRLVPLWNYWLAASTLPNYGVSTDNVHPSIPNDHNTAIFDHEHLVYGMNMRNLTALQVLSVLIPVLR